MNYAKIYYALIKRAKNLQSLNVGELHHIVPKCLGGSDDKDNIVKLSNREHFIAHILLTKIFPFEPKLYYAVSRMNKGNNINSRTYEIFRSKYREATGIPIYQWDLQGNFIKRYSSRMEVQDTLKIWNTQLSKISLGKAKSAGGYQWTNEYISPGIYSVPEIKVVYQFDSNGNYINEYASISEAHRKTKISITKISNQCNNKDYLYTDYIFSFNNICNINDYCKIQHDSYKKINQFTLEGKLITTYNSYNTINELYGYDKSAILKVCKQERYIAYGYLWAFENNNPRLPSKHALQAYKSSISLIGKS